MTWDNEWFDQQMLLSTFFKTSHCLYMEFHVHNIMYNVFCHYAF